MEISEILKDIASRLYNIEQTLNTTTEQKRISADELDDYLADGWKYVDSFKSTLDMLYFIVEKELPVEED